MNRPDIQFFTLDGEKNELQSLSWSKLPILAVFPKSSKAQALVYNGNLSIEDIKHFIEDQK
jgi:hypothetical protein